MAFFVAVVNYLSKEIKRHIHDSLTIKYTMKNRSFITICFCAILAVAVCGYLVARFALGFKQLSFTPAPDIGKIKYVDSNGYDVFASTTAVVFQCPINMIALEVEGDVAHITAYDFCIVKAPAYGVVKSADASVVVMDHGNSTTSTISGLYNVAVTAGQLVLAGQPIGTTLNCVDFSVMVSDLPMDMQWLLKSEIK